MDNKDKNYILDGENDDNEIVEYRERELEEVYDRLEEVYSRKGNTTTRKKPKNNKLKDFYKKNKTIVLWGLLGLLIIILIIALIVTNIDTADNDSGESKAINITEDLSDEADTDETTVEEDSFLAEPSDSIYNQLFEKYFQNSYVEWNSDALSECLESMQNVSQENYTYLNKYIEAVQDVVCYVGYETDDGKKLILVTYNLKFKNIDTVAPNMEAVIIVQVDDEYKIHNIQVTDELDYYTNQMQDNSQYQLLKSNINNLLGIALESDEGLKKVYTAFQNVGSEE